MRGRRGVDAHCETAAARTHARTHTAKTRTCKQHGGSRSRSFFSFSRIAYMRGSNWQILHVTHSTRTHSAVARTISKRIAGIHTVCTFEYRVFANAQQRVYNSSAWLASCIIHSVLPARVLQAHSTNVYESVRQHHVGGWHLAFLTQRRSLRLGWCTYLLVTTVKLT